MCVWECVYMCDFLLIAWQSKIFHKFKAWQDNYTCIIRTPHRYAYFEQLDWLEKKFYTSINSMSRNLGTIFLVPAPKIFNNVDKNMILMLKLEV